MSMTDVHVMRVARHTDDIMTPEQAWAFAQKWVAAWNDHDLARVLSYYRDDVELVSPFVRRIDGDTVGMLRGREAVGEFFASALERLPNLTFLLHDVAVDGRGLTLSYRSVSNLLSVETMLFDDDGLVRRVEAEYRPLAA